MNTKVLTLLKIAVAFALLYPGVASLIDPSSWIGFAPSWIPYILPKELFLIFFSVFEIALAFSILLLKRPFYPSLIAASVFFGVVIFNIGAMDIVFRDISIGLVSLALAMMSR